MNRIYNISPKVATHILWCTFMMMLATTTYSQVDSLYQTDQLQELESVVVTATKTERQLSNTTVPVTMIKSKAIKQTNAFRVQNVLEEYTGLNTVSSALGTGIQMQGLDADYALIMIDGVPIIGRLNGVLDLSRLSTANISHIEIVKGPSSVLFGSNALAGVVNIITKKQTDKFSADIFTRAGSFETYDAGAQLNFKKKKFQSVFSANYFTTGGYDLASNYQGFNISTDYYGKTVSPHSNYTLGSQNTIDLHKKWTLNLNGRLFKESESYIFQDADENIVDGSGSVTDWSVKPMLTYKDKRFTSKLRYNHSAYDTETMEVFMNEPVDSVYSSSFFNETYRLIDWQNDYKFDKRNLSTIGVGYEHETIKTSRLSSEDIQGADNLFMYAQHQYSPTERFDAVFGLRYEQHDNYKSQFNPKMSFRFAITPKYIFKASLGRGFKKPDFKQLYFNYTNNAIGYTVLGTTYVEEGIDQLLASNQIALDPDSNQPIIYDLYDQILATGGKIDAESSTGANFGLSIRSVKNTIIDINLYRNDLKNLIETTPIAQKTNGWQAYSYQNLSRVYTQGFDLDVKYYFNNNYKLSLGYQFLDAKNKDVLDLLRDGQMFAKDLETGVSYKLDIRDYGGLLNRSKHNINVKLSTNSLFDLFDGSLFEFIDGRSRDWFSGNNWRGIEGNIRVLYKSRFGYADLNNNGILDIDQEYIKGYFLVNSTFSKSFLKNKLRLSVGVDNIFNYTYATPEYTISSLPGRKYFLSINYKFTEK